MDAIRKKMQSMKVKNDLPTNKKRINKLILKVILCSISHRAKTFELEIYFLCILKSRVRHSKIISGKTINYFLYAEHDFKTVMRYIFLSFYL